jgi:hypothetical protein
MIFWLGFFSGGLVTVLACLVAAHPLPRDNKLAKQHLEIVEAQLRVFNERMVEERRLACALEAMVEHVTSANRQSTKFCTDDFHKACRIAGCVECPHCKCKV